MSESQPNITNGELVFTSSVDDLHWHGQQEAHAFERWHFDALSDDGREALVIGFHDNYPLSPRYFRQEQNLNGHLDTAGKRFPAVSLIYAVDGKAVVRTVNEFACEQFSAESGRVKCTIGDSSFELETASYGSGFVLHIDLFTARKLRIKAELEWLSIESDLSESGVGDQANISSRNIAVPRSDVSGRISVTDRHGSIRRLIHFRGTGYHDHFRSCRSLTETLGSSFGGRAHFIDSTAIFHCHDAGNDGVCSKLFLIKDGAMHQRDVVQKDEGLVRTGHGFKVPERLSLLSDDKIRLRIKPIKVFQSGFFESRMISEMTLTLRDGKPRKTVGITELLTPKLMSSRFFRWLTDLRIGKNGKGPIY